MIKNKQVSYFLGRLLLFLFLLFLADELIGFLFQKIYFSQKVGQFYQTTYAIDSSKESILVFGSSRAVRHYSMTTISKYTGLSAYNAGRDGQMIPYSTAVEEVSLNRHRPSLVILDINPWEFGIDQSKYEKLSILLPYYNHHNNLLSYLNEISPYEKYKLWSKIYPFNSSLFILAANSLFQNSQKKDDHGFLPLYGTMTIDDLNDYKVKMNQRFQIISKKKELLDYKAIKYFNQFLDLTKKNNIPTVLIISPTPLSNIFALDNKLSELNLIIKISSKYKNVTFLDYSKDKRFNFHSEFFSDVFHLNYRGATLFSKLFADSLIQRGILKPTNNKVIYR